MNFDCGIGFDWNFRAGFSLYKLYASTEWLRIVVHIRFLRFQTQCARPFIDDLPNMTSRKERYRIEKQIMRGINEGPRSLKETNYIYTGTDCLPHEICFPARLFCFPRVHCETPNVLPAEWSGVKSSSRHWSPPWNLVNLTFLLFRIWW